MRGHVTSLLFQYHRSRYSPGAAATNDHKPSGCGAGRGIGLGRRRPRQQDSRAAGGDGERRWGRAGQASGCGAGTSGGQWLDTSQVSPGPAGTEAA